jgi:hypothetical protein
MRLAAVALCALLVVPLAPVDARARTRAADLAVERVSVGAARAGTVTVGFTVLNRGAKRSRPATVRVTAGSTVVRVQQRPLSGPASPSACTAMTARRLPAH